jgi:hypothetical protein
VPLALEISKKCLTSIPKLLVIGSIMQMHMVYIVQHGRVLIVVDYDLMTVDLSSFEITQTTHAVWGKLPAIISAFEKYPHAEWVWWLDIDAIIMNPEIDLYEHLLDPAALQTKLVND